MNPRRFLVMLFAILLLSGCATQRPMDTASPYYQVAVGSLLKINRMIEMSDSVEDHGDFWQDTIRCGEALYELLISRRIEFNRSVYLGLTGEIISNP